MISYQYTTYHHLLNNPTQYTPTTSNKADKRHRKSVFMQHICLMLSALIFQQAYHLADNISKPCFKNFAFSLSKATI